MTIIQFEVKNKTEVSFTFWSRYKDDDLSFDKWKELYDDWQKAYHRIWGKFCFNANR